MTKARVAKDEVSATSHTGTGSRLYFADNLRSGLVILVVVHHVAIVYGAGAPFYYVEPPVGDPFAFTWLLVFLLFNQAWFMGALFFLAGYFTPGSFDRKGAGPFVRDRLVRLGVPLLFFYFVLGPLSSLGLWLMPESAGGIAGWPALETYPDLVGLGPMWFVALLLVFDFGYATWRALTRHRVVSSMETTGTLSYRRLTLFVVVLAAVSYLWRFVVPLGQSVWDFPTFAYLPQYVSLFVLGVVASRHNGLRTVPDAMGIVGLAAAAVASVVLFPLAFSGSWSTVELTEASANFNRPGHWQSAVYALWDSVLMVGLLLFVITFFRRFLGRGGGASRFLARHSYGVYVVHVPVIVYLAWLLSGLMLGPLPKFGLASLIMVSTSFGVAYVLLKVPLVARIL